MTKPTATESPRRAFLSRAAAVFLGTVAGIVPFVAGIVTLLDPLRRRSSGANLVKVARLDALPADGVPRKYPVIARRTDVWNKFPETPIGAVYLRRTNDTTIEAFNVTCPHAGCFVDYMPDRKSFLCPCHDSTFALDGKINDPKSPSPRGMDTLDVELREGEVWVRFQNFRAGNAKKIPEA